MSPEVGGITPSRTHTHTLLLAEQLTQVLVLWTTRDAEPPDIERSKHGCVHGQLRLACPSRFCLQL
eukprot:4925318-Heterocapsa_arctica.AAC.1